MIYSNKTHLSQFCHAAITAYLFNGSLRDNFRGSLKKFSKFFRTHNLLEPACSSIYGSLAANFRAIGNYF